MIIRISQALAKKLKLRDLAVLPPNDDPLRDWSMQMFMFDRKQHVIISNTINLYAAVFLAGRLLKPHALAIAGLQAIEEQLDGHLLLDDYQRRYTPRSSVVTYAKSLNRSVTGSMNLQILRATIALADGENLSMVGTDVNRNRLSSLRVDGHNFGRPLDAMTRYLEQTPSPRCV